MLMVVEKQGEANGEGQKEPRSALDELACEGARRMLTEALAAEVAGYIERHRPVRDEGGRALVVRNGRAEERQVIVGSGPMKIQAPRVNDKRVVNGERQRFTSLILPPYLRKSKGVSELLPALYLRGLSTGDFRDGLAAILGENASGLSPNVITRLVSAWQQEYAAWKTRSLADRDYVYVWGRRSAFQREVGGRATRGAGRNRRAAPTEERRSSRSRTATANRPRAGWRCSAI